MTNPSQDPSVSTPTPVPSQEVRRAPRRRHRQPLPRSARERFALAMDWCRRLPLGYVAGVGILAFGAAFTNYVVNSNGFALKSFEVAGCDRLQESTARDLLRTKLGVETGRSLVHLRPEVIRRTLLARPEVEAVTVDRRWPSTLLVTVSERRPAGIAVTNSGSYVYDSEGMLFAETRPSDFINLKGPLLTGFRGEALLPGSRIPKEAWEATQHLLATTSIASPSLVARMGELHWDEEQGLSIVLDTGTRILCARRPVEETGPVVESLLTRYPAETLQSASLVSPDSFTILPVPPQTPPKAQIARGQ